MPLAILTRKSRVLSLDGEIQEEDNDYKDHSSSSPIGENQGDAKDGSIRNQNDKGLDERGWTTAPLRRRDFARQGPPQSYSYPQKGANHTHPLR